MTDLLDQASVAIIALRTGESPPLYTLMLNLLGAIELSGELLRLDIYAFDPAETIFEAALRMKLRRAYAKINELCDRVMHSNDHRFDYQFGAYFLKVAQATPSKKTVASRICDYECMIASQ